MSYGIEIERFNKSVFNAIKNLSFAYFFQIINFLRMFLYLHQTSVRAVLTVFRLNRSRFLAYERMVEF